MNTNKDNAVLTNVQFGFYFADLILKPEDYYAEINRKLDNIFDATPIIQPVPLMPGNSDLDEIPVVQLASRDNIYRLNISRRRIDLFLNTQDEKTSFEDIREDFKNKVSVLSDKVSTMNITIKWVGVVANFFYEKENGVLAVSSLIDSRIKNLNEGTVHNAALSHTNRISMLGTTVNNLLSINKIEAIAPMQAEKKYGLLIKQDFNTRPSNVILTKDFIKNFIEESSSRFKLNEIVNLLCQ